MNKKKQVLIYIDDDTLTRVDDYRYTHRLANRSAAMLELIHLALEHVKQEQNKDSSEGTT